MDTKLKDCTTCKHHVGKSTLDDVSNECYPCVYQVRYLGYYPSWEPVEIPVTEEEDDEWVRREMGWQGNPNVYVKDNVNSPQHYTQGGIETIDFILAKLGKEGTIAYCMGNVIKYVTRWKDKNGIEDLKKAQWYLNYAIKLMKD